MTRNIRRVAILPLLIAIVAPGVAPAQVQVPLRAPVPVPAPVQAPSAWTVAADEASGSVRIAATAKDGGVRFTGRCGGSSETGISGAFSGYRGSALATDGEATRVAFYVRGAEWQDLFSVPLRYSVTSGAWELEKPLAPVFLSSFSRGATLAVVVRNEEIFSFDLTGSAAAAKAMRAVCGLD
jgi:hypothetical protein